MKKRFEGTLTALVTPFRNGAIDEEALRGLVNWQIDAGIDGLVGRGAVAVLAVALYLAGCYVFVATTAERQQLHSLLRTVAGKLGEGISRGKQ